jgi:hypothetical protein
MSASLKASHEVRIFLEFVERSQLPIDPQTVESRKSPEPDIRCVDSSTGRPRAFELVRLTDPQLAKDNSRQIKHGEKAQFRWTADPTESTYRDKVQKNYTTDCPVELLVYADLTASPDDLVVPTLREMIDRLGFGPFHRVWFLGEDGGYFIDERQPEPS